MDKTKRVPEERKAGLRQPSARIHVLVARKAPVAVIFRRGSSKWTQVIKWNTDDDTFEYGQWFRGQMYPRRSDLSPDGSLLVYFCAKWSGRRIEEAERMLDKKNAGKPTYDLRLLLKRKPKVRDEYTYAWTAVSRPPYLTALALWPKGDCWHGGGLFKSNRLLWLNHKPLVAVPHRDHLPVGLRVEANPGACGEDDPIYSMRLERDGWKRVQDWKYEWAGLGNGFRTEQPDVLEKAAMKNASMKLVMRRSISVFKYTESFSVKSDSSEVELRRAEWVDWDYAGRLVFFRSGRLYAANLSEFPTISETELVDLNPLKPEATVSPEWARRW
jgi:hypothetical protein